jgi:hypothetical protein
MISFNNFFFHELIIIELSEISLNKFEKEERVIELHKEGKTIRAIAPLVHMSFGPISKIIKAYDKKVRLEQTKKDENSQSNKIKKLSLSSQAYGLFLNGKTPVQVAMELNLHFLRVRRYWTEYLRLQNMKDLYNIYIDNEYHLDYLLHIHFFMVRNKIPKKDCEIVLRNAYTVINLNNSISYLKSECETWQRVKNNHYNAPLEPLPKINPYYPNYHF